MEETTKLKAPKKVKLTKPKPRKDVNQNNIPEILQKPHPLIPIRTSSLVDESADLRGDFIETQSYSSDTSSYVDLTCDKTNDNTENCSSLSRRNSTCSSVCSNSESNSTGDHQMSDLKPVFEVSMMRAPRKAKLTKPRPLRSSSSTDENGNDKSDSKAETTTTDNITDVTTRISVLLDELKHGKLSENDCLELRDLLAVHCPNLERINKEYIDNCFKGIEEILEEKTQDKFVLVSLRDLMVLRQREWQPYPRPSNTRKKSISWKDIAEEINTDCIQNNNLITPVETPMSIDSGIDLGDQVLWTTEESFEEDLTTDIWSKYTQEIISKERSPSPQSVIEAVKGLKIIGEDEEFVKAAAELLQKYLAKDKKGKEEEKPKESVKTGVGNSKNTVIRQPLGPGTNEELMKEVEKSLPSGRNTAKGRRKMFRLYREAVGPSVLDEDGILLSPKPYTREELLQLSRSPLSKDCPSELSYLSKVFPDVCFLQTDRFFHIEDLSSKDYLWDCPVRWPSKRDRDSDADSVCSDKPSYRRGFSCPTGEVDSQNDKGYSRGFSCPSGQMHSQNGQSGFSKPSFRRGFSSPAGDTDSQAAKGGFGTPNFKRANSSPSSDTDHQTIKSGFGVPNGMISNRLSGDGDNNGNQKQFGDLHEKRNGFQNTYPEDDTDGISGFWF